MLDGQVHPWDDLVRARSLRRVQGGDDVGWEPAAAAAGGAAASGRRVGGGQGVCVGGRTEL